MGCIGFAGFVEFIGRSLGLGVRVCRAYMVCRVYRVYVFLGFMGFQVL